MVSGVLCECDSRAELDLAGFGVGEVSATVGTALRSLTSMRHTHTWWRLLGGD